jgi:hypothetical protein
MATDVFTFTVALGKANRYADLPGANDALVLVLLKNTGLESDATLRDYQTLAAILAASNDEADFTGYTRRTLAGVAVAPNFGADTQSTDATDPASYTNTGGAAQVAGAAIVVYVPDVGVSTDAQMVPLYNLMQGTVTFDVGVPVAPAFAAAGLFTAAG